MSSASPLSRWLNWKPPILAEVLDHEPTKPAEPAFEGFEGDSTGLSLKIEAASALLNRAGVRIMALECGATIGMWSDLDGQEVRAALLTLGSDRLPFRYLDGAGIPMRYKGRRPEGEPVPMMVLAEMERDPAEPWNVRNRMLNEWAGAPIWERRIRQSRRDATGGAEQLGRPARSPPLSRLLAETNEL